MREQFSSVRVRRIANDSDLEKVRTIRHLTKTPGTNFDADLAGEFDYSSNAIVLIAEDLNGTALGTLRILNRQTGPIELDYFIDVDSVISHNSRSVLEASSFAVPFGLHSKMVKRLLWTSFFNFAVENDCNYLMILVGVGETRSYKFLSFSELERSNYFDDVLRIQNEASLILEISNSLPAATAENADNLVLQEAR